MIVDLEGEAHDQVWVVLSGLEEHELRGSRSCWIKPTRHEALLLAGCDGEWNILGMRRARWKSSVRSTFGSSPSTR